jgi:membrane associated rhomboid family serine protease
LYEFGRTFKGGQLWRPITSALHLGKVDMGFASQLYFLILYGQEMERQDGSAQHCVFILTQV